MRARERCNPACYTSAQLMDALDYNCAHALSLFAATSKTGLAQETRDVLLTCSGAPVAAFNQGFFKQPGYKLERTIDRVLGFRDRVKQPLQLSLGAEHAEAAAALAARGFESIAGVPVMQLLPIASPAFEAEGLTIRRVERGDATGLADFQRIAFESFGFPPELAPVALTEDLLAVPQVHAFVGYADGAPACCSMLLVTGELAGIYWVGTLAAFRKRGLGAAVTSHAVRAGEALGCRSACLQASAMGAPVYRRMGFTTPREYLRFVLPG